VKFCFDINNEFNIQKIVFCFFDKKEGEMIFCFLISTIMKLINETEFVVIISMMLEENIYSASASASSSSSSNSSSSAVAS